MTYVPLQVRYGEREPWRVLMICMLLNATSREQVEAVLDDFFGRWPDAESLGNASVAEVAEVIRSTGLADQKARYMVQVSYLWHHGVRDPAMLPGVGRYATEAVRIFCYGDLTFDPDDGVLLAYVRDRRGELPGDDGESGAEGGTEGEGAT